MAVKVPRKVGAPKVLAEIFRKSFVVQDFQDVQTGKIDSWSIFSAELPGAFILPVTLDNKVIVVQQFRFGAGKVTCELPSGGIKKGEEPSKAISRELLEETGYKAESIVSLSDFQPIFLDPASSDIVFFPFLGLGCALCQEQKLDPGEHVEVGFIEWERWLEMIFAAEVKSAPSMLTTLLSLPSFSYLKPRS